MDFDDLKWNELLNRRIEAAPESWKAPIVAVADTMEMAMLIYKRTFGGAAEVAPDVVWKIAEAILAEKARVSE